MRIDIWSDVVCPWCYLGANRLSAAIEQVGAGDVEVRWRAYQLDPGAPPEPQDLRTVLERKYGPGSFDGMSGRLVALGRDAGIDYRFDRALSVNTADAHRVIAWAGTVGAAEQSRLVQRLFRGYFTDGEDVSSTAVLTAAAADVGLDVEQAGEVLASSAFVEQVAADQSEARDLDITGVPAFVVDGRFMVPGAQEVDRFVSVLERARGTSPVDR